MWATWRETKCPPNGKSTERTLQLAQYDSLGYGGLKERGVAWCTGRRPEAANGI